MNEPTYAIIPWPAPDPVRAAAMRRICLIYRQIGRYPRNYPNRTNNTMATITTKIDSPLIKLIRPQIDNVLKELGERHGLVFAAGNASFSRDGKSGHFKLEVVAKDEHGKAVDLDAENFKRFATLHRLEPGDLGREVTIQHRLFVVCGLNPNARKNPILIKDIANDKVFTTSADVVRRQLHPDKK